MSNSDKEIVSIVTSIALGAVWGISVRMMPIPWIVQLPIAAGGGFLIGMGAGALINRIF